MQQLLLPDRAEIVAIVGSRDYPFLEDVRDYVVALPDGTEIVTGGARGVDRCAEEVAAERGLCCKVLRAEWETHGRSAGFRRNRDIVAACDRLVAFWDGVSHGTKHSILLALKKGKPVQVFPPEHEWVLTNAPRSH